MHSSTFFKEEVRRVLENKRFIDFNERFDKLVEMFSSFYPSLDEDDIEDLYSRRADDEWEYGYDAGHSAGYNAGHSDGYRKAEIELEGRIKGKYNNEFGSMLIREFDRGVEHGKKVVREEMNTAKMAEVPFQTKGR